MKVAILSDLHVHPWQEFSVNESRLHACVRVLDDVATYCERHSIGAIVFGGDLFHKRGVVYTRAYNLVVAALARIRDAGITVLAVDGNHDHADKAGMVHPMTALADAGLVNAVPPQGYVHWSLSDPHVKGDDLVVCGFSYSDDRASFTERVDQSTKEVRQLYPKVPRIGVFHHGFKGAAVGSALEYTVREDLDPTDLVSRWDYLFSGHYHQRQFIGGSDHMMYVGSPMEHVRGDGGLDKGFIVYDSQTSIWKLVVLDRPRFVKLTQKDIEDEEDVYRIVNGNYVDVVYEELPRSWEDYAVSLQVDLGAKGVKPVPVKREKTVAPRLAIDTSLDAKTVLKRYLKYREADIAGMDRTELMRLGMEYLNRAGK